MFITPFPSGVGSPSTTFLMSSIKSGGLKSLNYNNQNATLAPASNWRPNTFRNNAESADGSVYIPFAYVQTNTKGIENNPNPDFKDPSKAATEDPIKLE